MISFFKDKNPERSSPFTQSSLKTSNIENIINDKIYTWALTKPVVLRTFKYVEDLRVQLINNNDTQYWKPLAYTQHYICYLNSQNSQNVQIVYNIRKARKVLSPSLILSLSSFFKEVL